ncbi:MAG: AzlD domain-containing protein [Desulfosarcina sp.]|nr:AzlD domain-containing protein [Desulfobacterales bacterium]
MLPSEHTTLLTTVIAGAALVTYGLRLGGLLLSEKLPRSGAFKIFLEALPGTILISLVIPAIVAAGHLRSRGQA